MKLNKKASFRAYLDSKAKAPEAKNLEGL